GFLTGCRSRNQFKIIIKNGTIIDGSGTRTFEKDIGIIGDKIVAIDELENATADIIIDGKGLVVSPGFIDIHSHTDLELIVNPRAESKILQGVTTEVSGNCGSSPFPFNDSDFKEADENAFEWYGFHLDWRNIEAFLRKLEDQKVSINYATLTGHGSLRSCVIGKNDVQPTVEQLAEMKNILERTMQEGSFGLSTGLEYAPGSYALTSELIELNKTVARHNGIYATHMRSEYDRVEEAVQEALQICKKAEVSLQISHLKAANHANWGKVDHLLEMIHGAAESGMPVTADRYPYIAYSTGLTGFLPLWCLEGNTDDVLNRLRDKTLITKIRDFTENEGKDIGGWDRVIISYCSSDKNKLWEGKSISVCAMESNTTPFEFIQNLLLEERNRVDIVGFAMDEFNLKNVLSSPLVMIGSDGNAVAPYGKLGEGKPHPRSYGTFPRVLGKYSRDETLFDLSTAVMKMTSMPATKLGLRNRGLIAKDYFADIVVFNPETVIDNATFEDPHQFPTGIEYVIVNGKITVKNGKHTGTQAGAILRHQSS
ncbi:MAG: D-aminoacylase, partial [Anaerolineales bacterium]|nr:D-aminoacylase [Anaerolineales bacterium]